MCILFIAFLTFQICLRFSPMVGVFVDGVGTVMADKTHGCQAGLSIRTRCSVIKTSPIIQSSKVRTSFRLLATVRVTHDLPTSILDAFCANYLKHDVVTVPEALVNSFSFLIAHVARSSTHPMSSSHLLSSTHHMTSMNDTP